MKLEDREEVTVVKSVLLLGQRYLAVGTAIFPDEDDVEIEPYGAETSPSAKEGRLLLIEPRAVNSVEGGEGEKRWRCDVVESLKTVGPVYDVEVIHGFLAVSADSKVSFDSFGRCPGKAPPESD